MTTWTTFETIDESNNWDEFFIDRLGVHQYRQDERTRFKLNRSDDSWYAVDLETSEYNEGSTKFGSMREVIQWVSGRVLYGA